jgi:RNA polymerase sigma-70 factor (ECF subfamily)
VGTARNESAIRRAWEDGDIPAASTAAIEVFGPEVLRYLVGTLRDSSAADEAFSLFCERLWSALPRFEWKSSLRTWAYTIARHASIDVTRAAGRKRRREEPLSGSRASAIAARVRSATSPALRTETKSAIARLRAELPPEDRELLVLRVDRGLPWEELAGVFLGDEGASEAAVRRESARLRKRFQLVKGRLRERAKDLGIVEG